jgi:hypothetical protein
MLPVKFSAAPDDGPAGVTGADALGERVCW